MSLLLSLALVAIQSAGNPRPFLYVTDALSEEEGMHLVALDPKTGGPVRLTKGKDLETDAVRSPDGSRIAVSVVDSTKNFSQSICLFDADGNDRKTLVPADPKKTNFAPAWAPDGQSLVYSSMPSVRNGPGAPTLSRIESDGSGIRSLGEGLLANWAPDSKRILFTNISKPGTKDAMPALWTMDALGGDRKLIVPNAMMGAYSPKGDQFVYVSVSPNGQMNLFLRNADGSSPKQLTKLDDPFISGPAWLDDKTIVFTRAGKGADQPIMALYTVPVTGGQPKPLTKGGTMTFVGNGSAFFLVMGSLMAGM